MLKLCIRRYKKTLSKTYSMKRYSAQHFPKCFPEMLLMWNSN